MACKAGIDSNVGKAFVTVKCNLFRSYFNPSLSYEIPDCLTVMTAEFAAEVDRVDMCRKCQRLQSMLFRGLVVNIFAHAAQPRRRMVGDELVGASNQLGR